MRYAIGRAVGRASHRDRRDGLGADGRANVQGGHHLKSPSGRASIEGGRVVWRSRLREPNAMVEMLLRWK